MPGYALGAGTGHDDAKAIDLRRPIGQYGGILRCIPRPDDLACRFGSGVSLSARQLEHGRDKSGVPSPNDYLRGFLYLAC